MVTFGFTHRFHSKFITVVGENQQTILQDPLHVSIELITRARYKGIQEVRIQWMVHE
jgi:hypothetical protein